eukprot:m.48051 g.48051  ORF g.48051 m.48051 type:complete len:58 (-) comp13263_c0_seq5:72-245(-)
MGSSNTGPLLPVKADPKPTNKPMATRKLLSLQANTYENRKLQGFFTGSPKLTLLLSW